jgi:hypothetical protein
MGFDCLPFRMWRSGEKEGEWRGEFGDFHRVLGKWTFFFFFFFFFFPQRLSRLVRYLTARGKGSEGFPSQSIPLLPEMCSL